MTPSPCRRPWMVLVVDDDAIIRSELVETLDERGFVVVEAADSAEAIVLMEAHAEIVAVLTDVEMPGLMDGIKLAHYIRDRWPPIALFVISAQSRSADRGLPPEARFFGKPLDSGRLISELESALISAGC